ncbi:MAG: major capsid protein [Sulfurovum sp.]|nr:major capsid protein [Sulfurovum sp.]
MALKIDNEIVKTAMTEVLMQNVQNFNQGTNGAIILSSHYSMGDMEEYSMLAEIANLVARRDIAADTAAPVKTLSSVDENNVIVYFSTGSIEFKRVDARRYGSDVGAFSVAIGEQIGVGFTNSMLNRGLMAARAAIESQGVATVVGDGTAVASYTLLNDGLKLFGDASNSIVSWVMTGAAYHELIGDALTSYTIDSVAGGIINAGSVGSLGRPVYVTDSASLAMTTGTGILGLTAGALKIAETDTRDVFSEIVGGKENLKMRIQAESDVLIGVKGYSYTKTANPDDTLLGNKTSWNKVATDIKSTAGILVNVK